MGKVISRLCPTGAKQAAMIATKERHEVLVQQLRVSVYEGQEKLNAITGDIDKFKRLPRAHKVKNKPVWDQLNLAKASAGRTVAMRYKDLNFNMSVITMLDQKITQTVQHESAAEVTKLIGSMNVEDTISQMDQVQAMQDDLLEVDEAMAQSTAALYSSGVPEDSQETDAEWLAMLEDESIPAEVCAPGFAGHVVPPSTMTHPPQTEDEASLLLELKMRYVDNVLASNATGGTEALSIEMETNQHTATTDDSSFVEYRYATGTTPGRVVPRVAENT